MNGADLARRIVVRHREPGYLRFDLPAELCGPQAAAAIEGGLRDVDGVYRVGVDIAGRKLAVRYDEHLCGTGEVARRLKALLADLPVETPAATGGTPHSALPARAGSQLRAAAHQAAARLRTALAALRTPEAPAGSLQAKLQPLVASALTEKAVLNFLNDILAFYLIKVHWELIGQRWLRDPLKYRNAWLTVFYLVFLLVRFRKQSAKQ